MRVGIVGRTGMLLRAAEEIERRGHEIAFVMTCRSEPIYDKKEEHFEAYAKALGVPFYNTLNPIAHIREIAEMSVDVCISVNWLTLLKDDFLSAFQHGVLNAHAGDLPRYKGNACPNWAILAFEKRVGLTIHRMVEELDSGPYLLKRYLDINEQTYVTDIYEWMDLSIPEMFADALDLIQSQGFIEQDPEVRTLRTYPRKPEDSRIIWTESRRSILANIRASSFPFNGAFCFLNNTDMRVVVYRASAYDVDYDYMAVPGQVCFAHEGSPVVAVKDGMILIEDCRIDGYGAAESKALVLKSMRNRLS